MIDFEGLKTNKTYFENGPQIVNLAAIFNNSKNDLFHKI